MLEAVVGATVAEVGVLHRATSTVHSHFSRPIKHKGDFTVRSYDLVIFLYLYSNYGNRKGHFRFTLDIKLTSISFFPPTVHFHLASMNANILLCSLACNQLTLAICFWRHRPNLLTSLTLLKPQNVEEWCVDEPTSHHNLTVTYSIS